MKNSIILNRITELQNERNSCHSQVKKRFILQFRARQHYGGLGFMMK